MILNIDNEAEKMMKQMKHWGVYIEQDRFGWNRNRNRRKWFEISNKSVGITQIKCYNQNEEEKTKLSIQLANNTNKSEHGPNIRCLDPTYLYYCYSESIVVITTVHYTI